jgi:hypothetical protein
MRRLRGNSLSLFFLRSAGTICGMLVRMQLTAPARQVRLTVAAARRPSGMWWLAGLASVFTIAQLAFVVSPRMGLGWDEVVYVSQVSAHAPAAYFDSTRARGLTLLVAPVELVTPSFTALRVYLSVASGLGLLLALCAWRRVRPDWLLGLAGVLFGGLWVAQFNGPQAMSDFWTALSALAAVGCFLRFTEGHAAGRGWAALAGLAAAVAWAALIRPGDAMYVAAPLVFAALVARRWEPLVATVSGLVAGSSEWVIEADARFGGLRSRLHLAAAQQGGFGLHFSLAAEWHSLNGPLMCRPGWCATPVRDVAPGLWWLALPALVLAGLLAARRVGYLWPPLAVACAVSLVVEYLLMIDDASARYLLPAYALLAVPVADGLGWLVTSMPRRLRPVGLALLGALLAGQLASQHLVLDREVAGAAANADQYRRVADDLRALGVRPPCLLNGQQYLPIAYYMGCASNGLVSRPAPGQRVALLVWPGDQPPPFATRWHAYRLHNADVLSYIVYMP